MAVFVESFVEDRGSRQGPAPYWSTCAPGSRIFATFCFLQRQFAPEGDIFRRICDLQGNLRPRRRHIRLVLRPPDHQKDRGEIQIGNFSAVFVPTWMRQVQQKAVRGRGGFQVGNFSDIFIPTWKMLKSTNHRIKFPQSKLRLQRSLLQRQFLRRRYPGRMCLGQSSYMPDCRTDWHVYYSRQSQLCH